MGFIALSSRLDCCQSACLVQLLRLVQSCACMSMTECNSQSLCVSVRVTAELQRCCDSEQTGREKSSEWQRHFLFRNRFLLLKKPDSICKQREGEVMISSLYTWGNSYSTGTVVSPWTRGPVFKPCVSEHLLYEESEQAIESLPAPGLLLFNWPCALMFLWKGPIK